MTDDEDRCSRLENVDNHQRSPEAAAAASSSALLHTDHRHLATDFRFRSLSESDAVVVAADRRRSETGRGSSTNNRNDMTIDVNSRNSAADAAGIRRRLTFGCLGGTAGDDDGDDDSMRRFLERIRGEQRRRNRERWNYDFESDRPLPGRFQWSRVDGPTTTTTAVGFDDGPSALRRVSAAAATTTVTTTTPAIVGPRHTVASTNNAETQTNPTKPESSSPLLSPQESVSLVDQNNNSSEDDGDDDDGCGGGEFGTGDDVFSPNSDADVDLVSRDLQRQRRPQRSRHTDADETTTTNHGCGDGREFEDSAVRLRGGDVNGRRRRQGVKRHSCDRHGDAQRLTTLPKQQKCK